ncbi:MAG: phosphate acetyltransferase [Clostridia bacterium]|nr:phosphate acetyltransferase [Clostridia bacterium]
MGKFIDEITVKARSLGRTIILPESEDIRTIEATAKILEQGIAKVVLIGNVDEISALASKAGVDVSGATVIDPDNYPRFEEFRDKLVELRKAKGMTEEKATEMLKQHIPFGIMCLKMGIGDGLVAGACHSTADTMRPGLQIIKTAPDAKMVSSFFVMSVPNCDMGENGTFLFADPGLNENPDAEKLAEIAVSSAKSFEALIGATANVAMLSYSTYGSAHSELTEKVVEATRLAKEKAPDINLDGELQADAAIVPSVGEFKAPGSSVAGKANVLIFPDLNAGNISYKLVQRLAKAEAYGPIMQGFAKPVNDLSRGCSVDDIVGVVAVTAVQSTI